MQDFVHRQYGSRVFKNSDFQKRSFSIISHIGSQCRQRPQINLVEIGALHPALSACPRPPVGSKKQTRLEATDIDSFCNLHPRSIRLQNWGFCLLDSPRGLPLQPSRCGRALSSSVLFDVTGYSLSACSHPQSGRHACDEDEGDQAPGTHSLGLL